MSPIQIMSDLHLEHEAPQSYDDFEIVPKAPWLALLGDIGCVKDKGYFSFLRRQIANFRIVFLVLGNHEPYHDDWEETRCKMQQFERDIREKESNTGPGSFILLDQTRYDLSPDLTILGCTLFSNVPLSKARDVSFGLNDFPNIDNWTVEEHTESHLKDLEWLNDQVKTISQTEPGRKITVLTHYSPTTSPKATDPRYLNSKIASGFATNLSGEVCWTSGKVKAWAFGHTHFNCDFVDKNTGKRVFTNQRGYQFQQSAGFEASKCLELNCT